MIKSMNPKYIWIKGSLLLLAKVIVQVVLH